MGTPRIFDGFLIAFLLVCAALLPACSEPWLRVQHVPENGFHRTLNYQFQAQVHADSLGHCKKLVVHAKPLNKMYREEPIPARLRLMDDDCRSPVRFERVQFISNETGAAVRLSGHAAIEFLNQHYRMENELMGWLWRAGVTQ